MILFFAASPDNADDGDEPAACSELRLPPPLLGFRTSAPVVEEVEGGVGPLLVFPGFAILVGEVVLSSARLGTRCRRGGVGKLSFLSMASTVRWKRRKRA